PRCRTGASRFLHPQWLRRPMSPEHARLPEGSPPATPGGRFAGGSIVYLWHSVGLGRNETRAKRLAVFRNRLQAAHDKSCDVLRSHTKLATKKGSHTKSLNTFVHMVRGGSPVVVTVQNQLI